MNILYLAHRVPYPPNKGDKLRSYNQIKHLAERHEIWCAAFADDPADRLYAALLQRICREVCLVPVNRTWAGLRGMVQLLRGGTATQGFYRDRRMEVVVARWSREIDFDAVLAFSSGMADYATSARARTRIIDFCDLDSHKWLAYAPRRPFPLSWAYRVEGSRLAEREQEWLRSFDQVTVISEAEKADLVRHDSESAKVTVVGNGVSLPSQQDLEVPASGIVGFIGSMNYPPNVDAVSWFANDIWPAVRAEQLTARFQIVGRAPTRAVRRLAQRAGIEVLGEVPHVIEHMRNWQVSVAPMRLGRGLQNKVLESMAASRPVVVTPLAAAGLSAADAEHVLVADSAESFSSAVSRLIDDADYCERLGRLARRTVAREHSWPREVAKLEALFAPENLRVRYA